MAIPIMTIEDLSVFTGKPVSAYGSFGAFVTEAISQATLLFSLATGLTELPQDEFARKLAINAILEMANALYLNRAYADVEASPFASESIGSYSYSKLYKRMTSGGKLVTDLMWFDLAVERLGVFDVAHNIGSGGISVFHSHNTIGSGNHKYYVGPAERQYIIRSHYQEDPSMVGWFRDSGFYGGDYYGGDSAAALPAGGDGFPVTPDVPGGGSSTENTRRDDTFEYHQYEPANDWIIDHYMNGFPDVTIILANGSSFRPTVYYIDNNRLRVHMNPAMSGEAKLQI